MSNAVDTRVVAMVFDNDAFEKGVEETIASLQNLDVALETSGNSSALQQLADSFSLSGLGSKISGFVDTGVSALNSLGTTFRSLETVISGVTSAINGSVFAMALAGGKQRALNIEQARFQLEGLGISWDQVSGSINAAVDGTAYGLDSAAKAASQLAASQVQLGDDMTHALGAISGVAAMTNSEYDDIARIFTTVAGNGHLMGQQLTQLGARGLNAAATLSEAFGITEEEVREMARKSQISFNMFSEAMYDAFYAHAKDANKTFTGALSNVKAALNRIGALFYETDYDTHRGGLEFMRQTFVELIPALNAVKLLMKPVAAVYLNFAEILKDKAVASLSLFRELLVDFDTEANKIVGNSQFLDNLIASIIGFADALNSLVEPFRRAFANVFAPITSLRPMLTPVSERLLELVSNLKLTEGAIQLLQRPIELVLSGVKRFISLIAGIGSFALDSLASTFLFLKQGFDAFADALNLFIGGGLEVLGAILEELASTMDLVFSTIRSGFGQGHIAELLSEVASAIVALGDAVFRHGFFGIFSRVQDVFANFALSLEELGKTLGEKDLFSPIIEWAKGVAAAFGDLDVQVAGFLENNPIVAFFSETVQNIHGMGQKIRDDLTSGFSAVQAFKESAEESFNGVQNAFQPLDRAQSLVRHFGSVMRDVFLGEGSLITNAIAVISRHFNRLKNLLASLPNLAAALGGTRQIQGFADSIFELAKRLSDSLYNKIHRLIEHIRDFVRVAKEVVHSGIDKAGEYITKFARAFQKLVNSIKTGFLNGFSKIFDGLGAHGARVREFVNSIEFEFDSLEQFLKAVFNNTLGKILGNWDDLIERFKSSSLGRALSSAGGYFDWFGSILDERAPSVEEWSGLLRGLKSSFEQFGKVRIDSAIVGAFGELSKAMTGFGTDAFSGLGSLAGGNETLAAFLDDVSLKASDMFSTIRDHLPTMDDLKEGFSKVADGAVKLVEKLAPVAETIGYKLGEAFGKLKGLLRDLQERLSELSDPLEAFAKLGGSVAEAFDQFLSKFTGTEAPSFDDYVRLFSSLKDSFGEFIQEVAPDIAEALEIIGKFISDIISSKYEDVVGTLNVLGGALTEVSAPVSSISESLSKTAPVLADSTDSISKSLGDLFREINLTGSDGESSVDAVVSPLDRLKDILGGFGEWLLQKAPAIVAGFTLMAAAISGLKLVEALTKLTSAATELLEGASGSISTVVSNNLPAPLQNLIGGTAEESEKESGGISEAIEKIVKSIAILAASLYMLSTVDIESLKKGGIALGAIAASLAAFMIAMGVMTAVLKKSDSLDGLSSIADIVWSIGKTIAVLVAAVMLLGNLFNAEDPSKYIAGLGGVIGLMVVLAGGLYAIGKAGPAAEGAAEVVDTMAKALVLLALAVQMLGTMEWTQLALGVAAIGGIAFILTVFAGSLAQLSTQIAAVSIPLVSFAAAIVILTLAVVAISQIPVEQIGSGLLNLGLVLGSLVAALWVMAKFKVEIVEVSTSLIIFAGALLVMSAAVAILSGMDTQGLLAAAVAVAGLAVGLGYAMKMMSGFQKTAGAIVVLIAFSGAVVVLSVALSYLAGIPMEKLALGVLAILAPIIGLSVAARMLAAGVGPMLAFGAAVLAFGVGIAAASIGVHYLMDLLSKMATSTPAQSKQIGNGFKNMAAGVKEAAPEMGNAFAAGIISTLTAVASAGGEMIGSLLLGIASKAEAIGNTALTTAIMLLNGLANAISENGHIFLDAVGNILMSIGSSILIFLADLIDSIVGFSNPVSDAIREAGESMAEASQESAAKANEAFADEIGKMPDETDKALADTKDTAVSYEDVLATVMGGDANAMLGEYGATLDDLPGVTSDEMGEVAGVVADSGGDLESAAESAAEGIPEGVGSVQTQLLGAMNGNLSELSKSLQNFNLAPAGKAAADSAVKGIKSGFDTLKSKVSDAMNALPKAVRSASSGAWSDGKYVGEQAGSGMSAGLYAKWWSVYTAAKSLASAAKTGASITLQVKSPSRVMRRIGEHAGEGLALGMTDTLGMVASAGERLAHQAAESSSQGLMTMNSLLAGIDWDAEPTITPVLDLSQIESGARLMAGMLTYSSAVAGAGRTARAFAVAGGGSNTYGGNTTINNYSTTLDYTAGDDALGMFRDFMAFVKASNELEGKSHG